MSNFEDAIEFLLPREGGLSENPNDSGGITNFGISLRFLRSLSSEKLRRYGIFEPVNDNTIKLLTISQAKFIYKGEFWEGNRLDEIESQQLVNYIFDMYVNHGIAQANKLVQRAVCAATFMRNYLRDDGLLGDKTISAINSLGEQLLPITMAIRSEFYRNLVVLRPKDEANLDGWLNRCYDLSM